MAGASGDPRVWSLVGLVQQDRISMIDLRPLPFRIGRRPALHLTLPMESVSTEHAEFYEEDGTLRLRDLGSTNGTRVNGTRVRRAALLPNDKVSFANFHFRVHLGPMDVPAGPDEHTQAIEPGEVQKALAANVPLADSGVDEQFVQIQVNALPDVYPEDGKK